MAILCSAALAVLIVTGATPRPISDPPELVAANITGPRQLDIDSTGAVNILVLNSGGPLAGDYGYEVLLSADTSVDPDDLVIASGTSSVFGSLSVPVVIPPDVAPGSYNWGLRIAIAPGELLTHNNAVITSAVELFIIDLEVTGGTAFNVQATTGGDDPDPISFGVQNTGSAHGVLIFTVTEVPEVPWLSASPASSFALAGGSPQPITVSFDLDGLTAGQYTTTLLVRNFWDAGDYETVAITLSVGDVTLVPGDLITGNISAPGEVDEALFTGLAGMRLKLRITAQTGNLRPLVTVLAEAGGTIAEWSLPYSSRTIRKSVKLPATGAYRLRIGGAAGSVGAYTIGTSRQLRGRARSFSRKLKPAPGTDSGSTEILALAGAQVKVTARPTARYTGTPIALSVDDPQHLPVDLAGVTELLAGGAVRLNSLILAETGAYQLNLTGFAADRDRVKITVKLTQPPAGTATVILP